MKINNAEMPDHEFWALVEQHGGKRPTGGKRWRAKKGEPYWTVINGGMIVTAVEEFDVVDNYRYASGDYHRTREEAEKYRDRQLATMRVLDRKLELETEYGAEAVDWEKHKQNKYCARYEYTGGKFIVMSCVYLQASDAERYSTNYQVIKRLIEEMPNDLKLMMGVE